MPVKLMRETFRLSFGEEVGNAVSHGVMAVLCLFSLPAFAVYSYAMQGIVRSLGTSIYLISMFFMFLISTIYHSMPYGSQQKYVFRKLDHIAILFAIAGSYTPAVLCVMDGFARIGLLLFQWGMVLIGIFYKIFAKKKNSRLSLILYLCMGWSVIVLLPQLLHNASLPFLLLVAGGGIAYSIGAVIYAKKPFAYSHVVWHFFVALAAVLQGIGFVYCLV